MKGDPHVLHRTRTGTGQHLERHEHVIDQVGRPADDEQQHHGHQHFDYLNDKQIIIFTANSVQHPGSTSNVSRINLSFAQEMERSI